MKKGVCGESKGKLDPTAPSGAHEHELEPKDRLEPVSSVSNLGDMDVPPV